MGIDRRSNSWGKALQAGQGVGVAIAPYALPQHRSREGVMCIDIGDDDAFFFTSYLRMNFVMQSNVTGFTAHPSDYYEITAQLQVG